MLFSVKKVLFLSQIFVFLLPLLNVKHCGKRVIKSILKYYSKSSSNNLHVFTHGVFFHSKIITVVKAMFSFISVCARPIMNVKHSVKSRCDHPSYVSLLCLEIRNYCFTHYSATSGKGNSLFRMDDFYCAKYLYYHLQSFWEWRLFCVINYFRRLKKDNKKKTFCEK